MNFEPRHKQHWGRATEPQSLQDMWSILESYIYVISKEFKPHEDEPEVNLVKLGFSKFADFNNSYKGLSRLTGFKTSLISFKVHRLYLYGSFDTNLKSARAYQAEQRLHEAIETHYKPERVRIKFRGHASITDLDPNTEWFSIPKDKMDEFLKWLDEQAFYEINPVAVYGTSFTKTTSSPIPFDKERSAAAEVMLDVISSRTRTKKGLLTQHQNKTAHVPRQIMAQAASKKRRSIVLKEHAALEKTLKRDPSFFQAMLVKQRFRDPDLDGDKWQDKVITDADLFDTPSGERYKHIRVLYEPAPRGRGEKPLTTREKDKYGGVLSIPETLFYFPKIKKKYEDIFDWYVVAERLDAERVGQSEAELWGGGGITNDGRLVLLDGARYATARYAVVRA